MWVSQVYEYFNVLSSQHWLSIWFITLCQENCNCTNNWHRYFYNHTYPNNSDNYERLRLYNTLHFICHVTGCYDFNESLTENNLFSFEGTNMFHRWFIYSVSDSNCFCLQGGILASLPLVLFHGSVTGFTGQWEFNEVYFMLFVVSL